MSFCLLPSQADVFLGKLRKGEINPDKLSGMKSSERRAFFSEFLGETAGTRTNALFESKLLLKNQQQGIINWAKQLTGIKPEVRRDILNKAERMTEILQPSEIDGFLNDLVAQRLGLGVSVAEASKIADLAKVTAEKRTAWDGKKWNTEKNRLEFGAAKVAFGEYVAGLKLESQKLGLIGAVRNPVKIIEKIGGTAKSLKASFDLSTIFRQGWKVLWTSPTIWAKNSAKAFIDAAQTVGGKNVMDAVNADILSRPNAMNGLYGKEKLAISNVEEDFPENIVAKVPVIGRLYKASETGYTAFQYRTRADVFDKYVEIAKKSGADIEGIGKLVNTLTGRGHLKKTESIANTMNAVFFAPRFVRSQFDFLTGMAFQKEVGSFARKTAALNLVKVISGTAGVLAIANAVLPGSVEFDPRSSDFGKIRVGDTRFDVSGGMGSLITLAVRQLSGQIKSSSSGNIIPLDSDAFGAMTRWDVAWNFTEGKFSPAASLVKDLMKGKTFEGEKLTLQNEAMNLFVPLPISNYLELASNPNAANPVLASIADALGVGTNTYTPTSKFDEFQETYDEIQKLKSDGKNEDADRAFDNLTSGEKKTYKMLELKPQYDEIEKLKAEGETTKAEELYNKISKKDQTAYKALEKEFSTTSDKENKVQNSKTEKSLIDNITTYAEAIGTDPATAFDRIFSGQYIRRTDNGAIIVERMSLEDSQNVKKEGGGNNPGMKLDHTIPLQLGGSNSKDNLKLVTTDEWKSYTKVENYLGEHLRDKKISKTDALNAITKFKEGKISFDEIKRSYP